jgi:hypothetical protein
MVPMVHVYVRTYQCYHYLKTIPCIPVVRIRVRTYTCTYVRTMVRTYTCTYNINSKTYGTRVWYVLIMLCRNFGTGKGHTRALRTTCVLGVPWYTCTYSSTMVRTYHGTYTCTYIISKHHGTRVPVIGTVPLVRGYGIPY